MNAYILKNGKIFDGETFFNGDIWIENGRITAIGDIHDRQVPVFDISDCIVSSGLVDIHTHLRM